MKRKIAYPISHFKSIILFDNIVLIECLNESLDDNGQLILHLIFNNWSWLIYFHLFNVFKKVSSCEVARFLFLLWFLKISNHKIGWRIP
ncbi:hypothetical protein IMY05_013G0041100 [Salix suchowensis]|nr:hypothetical protein IMY05_013G0041100 [Salix suchowensis]